MADTSATSNSNSSLDATSCSHDGNVPGSLVVAVSKNAVDKNNCSRSTVGLRCSLPQLGCSFRSGSRPAAGDSVNYP